MYLYDDFDRTLVAERVAEFRDQVARRLSGELTEDEFKPLRLMNGVYLQLHAYMLRIAIPYGTLSSEQMRMLAHVARRYDRNYGHFTTRQNIQFNWIKLAELPDAMADLARAGLHGMQTSGNCVRNITTDQWAGVAPDEIEDPRIWAEILRQHLDPASGILVPAAQVQDRGHRGRRTTARRCRVHDIGLRLHRNGAGETGFEVIVGGGLGRTPFVGKTIKPFLPKRDLLSYVEAILRVYNQYGRRDNIYKARIKILVHELGAEAIRASEVEAEWQPIKDGALALDPAVIADIAARFRYPDYEPLDDNPPELAQARAADRALRRLARQLGRQSQGARLRHRDALAQARGRPAGRRHRRADGRDRRSRRPLFASAKSASATSRTWCCRMWRSATCRRCGARSTRSAWRRRMSGSSPTSSPARGSTIAASPIRARSRWRRRSPAASAISTSPRDLGRLHINISGCINACGHHHVGHIGILGVEKNGEEYYQITLGGRADENAELGALLGPAVPYARGGRRGRGRRRGLSRAARRGRTRFFSTRSSASASSRSRSGSMPLVKGGQVVEDRYRAHPRRGADPGRRAGDRAGGAVSRRRRASSRGARRRPACSGRTTARSRSLRRYLDRLALVALVFPTFKDGRAYSQARLLRERYGFRGELRATGEVLRDQFLFLLRAGFDAFEVKKDADAAAFAEALARYSVFYQPAGDGRPAVQRARLGGARLARAAAPSGPVSA